MKKLLAGFSLACLLTIAFSGVAEAVIENVSLEAGTITTNHLWTTITFEEHFANTPIVFAEIQTENGGQSGQVEIKNVTTTSFQVRFEEDRGGNRSWLDGRHTNEDMAWIALDPAEIIPGYGVEAGTVNMAQTNYSYWENVGFPGSFDETPLILVQTQTRNGGDTENPDIRAVDPGGFEMRVEENPGNEVAGGWDGRHTTETIGYLAVNLDISEDGILWDSQVITNSWTQICFNEDCSEAYMDIPSVFVEIQTENEADTALADLRNITTSGFEVRIEELTVAGWDGLSVGENVGWLSYGSLIEPEPEYDPSQYDVLVMETSSPGVSYIISILEEAGYNVDSDSIENIAAGISTDYEILIMPGSSDPVYAAMNGGLDSVQDFVAQGGGAIGVCGGAIAGSENVHLIDYFGIMLAMTGIGQNITSHYDTNWLDYIGDGYNPDVLVETDHPILGDYSIGDTFAMAYRGGPVFEVGEGVTVLLSYTETFDESYPAE
ncbi:MAG: hemolysin-type calcium-binding repeat-containing protein, partial [uncultured bacterium]